MGRKPVKPTLETLREFRGLGSDKMAGGSGDLETRTCANCRTHGVRGGGAGVLRRSAWHAGLQKPETLRGRGGCWFPCGEEQLHIGVEADFRAAKRAHPAFAVDDLDELRLRLRLAACGVKMTEDDALPDIKRFYAEDPWGNRLKFVEGKCG